MWNKGLNQYEIEQKSYNGDYNWIVPLNIVFADGSTTKVVLEEQSQIFDFNQIFKLNAGSTGFYVSNYDHHHLIQICKFANMLTLQDLTGLLIDI